MRSVFRYPGGTTRKGVQCKILSYAPDFYREYREPFVGGGGIFFAVDEALDMEGKKKKWINDLNENLVSVYKSLRDSSDDFINDCQSIEAAQPNEPEVHPMPNSTGKTYNARLKSHFDRFVSGEGGPALRYFFINRTVWGGRVNYDPKRQSRMYFSNPTGWNIVKTSRLQSAARYIQGTKITSGDFVPLLSKPGKDVWIYCDPPYIRDTELVSTDKLYEFGFTMKDHKRLAKAIKNCKHKVALSYDDDVDGIVRGLYKGFNVYELEWAYSGTSLSTKDIGRELLITNYEPHTGRLI